MDAVIIVLVWTTSVVAILALLIRRATRNHRLALDPFSRVARRKGVRIESSPTADGDTVRTAVSGEGAIALQLVASALNPDTIVRRAQHHDPEIVATGDRAFDNRVVLTHIHTAWFSSEMRALISELLQLGTFAVIGGRVSLVPEEPFTTSGLIPKLEAVSRGLTRDPGELVAALYENATGDPVPNVRYVNAEMLLGGFPGSDESARFLAASHDHPGIELLAAQHAPETGVERAMAIVEQADPEDDDIIVEALYWLANNVE